MSRALISIDRSDMAGALTPLVFTDDGPVFRLTEDGVGYVVQSVRTTTMPDSVDADGTEIIAYAHEATSLPIEFHIFGSSAADLAAKISEVEDAFYRLTYPVTRTVDGVAKTYGGAPCALVPKRGAVDAAVQAAHFDTFSVVIPFPNPNGA